MPKKERRPNVLLRRARGERSQEQVAELANQEILTATGVPGALTAKSISDLECGWYSWPSKHTRDALCRVLGVSDPAELGFRPQRARRATDASSAQPRAVVIGTGQPDQADPMNRRTFLLSGAASLSGTTMVDAQRVAVSADDQYGFAASVSERWPEASLRRPVPDRGTDWQLGLPAGRAFDGAEVAVQIHGQVRANGNLTTAVLARRRFEQFTRHRVRSLLVVADEREDQPTTFYAIDAREAARQALPQSQSPDISVPRAYLLDDITFGAVWAAANLDQALLSDDALLHRHRQDLAHYEGLTGSAASREEAPDLAEPSQMWLGSAFCARHILRNLDQLDVSPVFWTREQRGEEASTWLLWQHKLAYLRRTSTTGSSVARGFCIPEHLVDASPRHERVLLLMSAALMEANGIRICVTPDPSYAEVAGFVLGGRAIVANWVRTPGLWHVDTTTTRQYLARFGETAGNVTNHSVIDGPTPARRLLALASYLRIPWPWFRARCVELGESGFERLVMPRSRLLSVDGLNIAARYVGRLAKV